MVDAAALRARLDSVRSRIERAASRVGRDSSSIRLVAVAKTFGVEHVRIAAEAGQIDFGENRVQEATRSTQPIWATHLSSRRVRPTTRLNCSPRSTSSASRPSMAHAKSSWQECSKPRVVGRLRDWSG